MGTEQASGGTDRQHAFQFHTNSMLTIVFLFKSIYVHNNSSHLQDLKEITHDYLYENYRTEKLSRSADNLSD